MTAPKQDWHRTWRDFEHSEHLWAIQYKAKYNPKDLLIFTGKKIDDYDGRPSQYTIGQVSDIKKDGDRIYYLFKWDDTSASPRYGSCWIGEPMLSFWMKS